MSVSCLYTNSRGGGFCIFPLTNYYVRLPAVSADNITRHCADIYRIHPDCCRSSFILSGKTGAEETAGERPPAPRASSHGAAQMAGAQQSPAAPCLPLLELLKGK
ncbi:hypothetical protein GDO81_010948 [Engystomops pustulosus]|uniref:Prolamin-like domain-containing protein n=1 Tax=Engystomops pustulosus TaxID=76066 RepID=A0AAV7C3P7_ENGPU|nr:hypothetical protein GDO81_010948 [Engystomops pustulosus]